MKPKKIKITSLPVKSERIFETTVKFSHGKEHTKSGTSVLGTVD